MVVDTNPIAESSWNMDWEDWLSQRKLTIAFYPFTVTKVTNVGTNWKPIHSFLLLINSNMYPISQRFWYIEPKVINYVSYLKLIMIISYDSDMINHINQL